MKRLSLLIVSIFITHLLSAQNIRIGEWRSHLNYNQGIKSEEVGNRIFCATKYGLFYVNTDDNSINPLSKKEGFSDINISTIGYDKESDMLFVAYTNTKIDILKNNRVFTLSDIYRKFIPGRKVINNIYFHDKKAYISCSFGVVVYDIERDEIKETYENIGGQNTLEVFNVSIIKDSIYAATNGGVLSANTDDNLLDYRSWKKIFDKESQNIVPFNDKVYTYSEGFIYHYDENGWTKYIDSLENSLNEIRVCNSELILSFKNRIIKVKEDLSFEEYKESSIVSTLCDSKGRYWFTFELYPLVKYENSQYYFYEPNGPYSNTAWDIDISENEVLVAGGALTFQYGPTFSSNGVYIFDDERWSNINPFLNPEINKQKDIVSVKIDPVDKHYYLGSFGGGLAEFVNGQFVKVYNSTNSSLGYDKSLGDSANIKVSGMAFDNDGNLWISNLRANDQLSVKRRDGKWQSYSFGTENDKAVGDIVVDDYGQKWMTLPITGGLLVFDENVNGQQRYRKLSDDEGQGNLPSTMVTSIAKDKEGRIWIGTQDGLAVVYDPSDVFSGYNYDAQEIWIESDNESGYLLSGEEVTAIEVDGSNKKWLGTRHGVWYVSEDGTNIIYKFTTENSPLPADFIRDIAVDDLTGEVFFATDNGIVSFRNTATEGNDKHENVYAFPNPVRENYDGPIAIRGLVSEANVKITDAAGNLVYETFAEGGQATWDGRTLSGDKVRSGVYLIFSTNEDGTETHITKLLIIR